MFRSACFGVPVDLALVDKLELKEVLATRAIDLFRPARREKNDADAKVAGAHVRTTEIELELGA
jgi:hypothetical protein